MLNRKKDEGCKNNPEKSSTTKVDYNIPSGSKASFKDIENKHGVYRGEDFTKRCYEYLREHAIKIINF